MAATPGASTSNSTSSTQEYSVRIPKDKVKRFSMMKYGTGSDLDFAKLGSTTVGINRENNFKEFKTANDIDLMPKFGAGSEFGREQKEEARRKKYGRRTRNYNPEDQPWMMKIGSDKKAKRYKGVREGTITENTSYYIFTQCADGAFEACPVDEWYNFTPVIKYKFLNADEAEEHFERRDKTLNYFNIMAKKRMKVNDGTEEEVGEKPEPKQKKKSKKDFMLTDADDWVDESEEEDGDDEDEEQDPEKKAKKPKIKKKKGPVKKKKNAKINSDDEAVEESDDDYDDREVDYMSDSSSNPSEKEEEDKEKDTKDEEKGVAEEDGLRVLIDSEAEDEEEEEKKEETIQDIDPKDPKKKKEDESDSSSSSSASDSDIEKDESISSALFMAKSGEKKKSDSRPPTPNNDERGTKRKLDGDAASGKKPRTDSPVPTSSSTSTTSSSSEGITEEAIRRYLMRKPMTTRDLLTKFRSKKLNMTSEKMTHTVAQLLKKINPEKKFINKILYLSLKKTD